MLGDKLRFRFRKDGDLRLLSHHDLMRCVERMLRRAEIPFKSTAGFHPGPRVVFALSLPLGVAGCEEVMEIELLHSRDAEDVLDRLNGTAPTGLAFTRFSVVPMKATAVPRRAVYRLPLPSDRVSFVAAACEELLRRKKIWVDRQRPTPKQLNIRPYLCSLRVEEEALIIDLWVTGTGTARAEELIGLLELDDVRESGAVLERSLLEIRDETPAGLTGDEPPTEPAESLPLVLATAAGRSPAEANQSADAGWGASPNGPVVE